MGTLTRHVGLFLTASLPLVAGDLLVNDAAEMAKIVPDTATVRELGSGMRFIEGPIWIPRDGGYLVFSDIPADELRKWTPGEGVTVFRTPSHNANGNCLDLQGRLVSCQHGSRTVTVTDWDDTVRTIAEKYDGKKFNSPNDAAFRSDGTLWFTDPDYGLKKRPKEQPGNYVYRLDPLTNQVVAMVKDFDKPNGICWSPDEKRLYIADSGKPKHIRAFDVDEQGNLSNDRVFCTLDKGVPDGIRCDADGRLYSSAGDGVHIFAPDGRLLGKILVPQAPANLCFGGPSNTTLFMTARKSLYAVDLLVRGDR